MATPAIKRPNVYGNLIDIPANFTGTQMLFYGGDSGKQANYRQGTLHFYNNTLVVVGDGKGIYPDAFLFFLTQPNAVAQVWNNIFYAAAVTPGKAAKAMAMAYSGAGTVNLMNNWMSSTVAAGWVGHPSPAKVTGWAANTISAGSPGFLNAAPHLYTPAAGSALINAGTPLAQLKAGTFPLWLPQNPSTWSPMARKNDGQIDVGAYEY